MVKYTFDDVKVLTREIAHYFRDKDTKVWLDVAYSVKEEFSEVKEMILELIGPYTFTFTRKFSKKIGLTDLIFNTSVRMMPVYIESKNDWEKVVARWRMTIQK